MRRGFTASLSTRVTPRREPPPLECAVRRFAASFASDHEPDVARSVAYGATSSSMPFASCLRNGARLSSSITTWGTRSPRSPRPWASPLGPRGPAFTTRSVSCGPCWTTTTGRSSLLRSAPHDSICRSWFRSAHRRLARKRSWPGARARCMEVVGAALPSLPQRRSWRTYWRFSAMPRVALAVALAGLLVIGVVAIFARPAIGPGNPTAPPSGLPSTAPSTATQFAGAGYVHARSDACLPCHRTS